MESLLPEPLPEHSDAAALALHWTKYKRQLQWFLQANKKGGESSTVKLAVLLRTIGPRGIDIYDNFDLSDEDKEKYQVVIDAFEAYCKPRVSKFAARHKFLTMKQGDQSVDEFVTALRKQAREYCDFGTAADEWILHALALGLKDDKTRMRLFEKEDLDLDGAIKICRTVEDTRREMEGLRLNEEVSAVYAKQSANPRTGEARPPCQYCGTSHRPRQCPAYGKKCKNCAGMNHFARVCKRSRGSQASVNKVEDKPEEGEEEAWMVQVERKGRKLMAHLEVTGTETEVIKPLTAQLDTAATCNVLSYQTYLELGSPGLKPSNKKLNMYNNTVEQSMGTCWLEIMNLTHPRKLKFEVVGCENMTLLSLDACLELQMIQVNEKVHMVQEQNKSQEPEAMKGTVDEMLIDYKEVFEGLGCLPGEYDIALDETIPPVQNRPRRIALSMQEDVKKKIDALEMQGIIARVDTPTKWISNMLAIRKPSGAVRVCIDPSELNKAVRRNHFPMPTLDDILPTIQGAKVFSLVDAKDGFLQVKLSEESSYLTTFWTPHGRYRWCRMPFGLSSSPEEFQRRLTEALEGLKGIAVVADDILIVGRGNTLEEAEKDHNYNFRELLKRAQKKNLKLNRDKLRICLREMPYIGHLLTEKGVKVDPKKQQAATSMNQPKSVEELRRFLGFINYMARFLPNVATVTEPMRRLLVKDSQFEWTSEQQSAFARVKEMICACGTLSYFDPAKPIILQCDASTVGLGAVLLQEGKPIAYASRSLTSTEKNYVPLELECLAVVFGCQRFDQYIYGQKEVLVHTDHQPLEFIFRKSLLVCPRRLQRMRLMLQRYDIQVRYRQGVVQVVADMLSRSPEESQEPKELVAEQVFQCARWSEQEEELEAVEQADYAHVGEGRLEQVQKATEKDKEMQALITVIQKGWPNRKEEVHGLVKQYWSFRDELTTSQNIVYRGERIVLPKEMRTDVLKKLHKSHQGIEATLRRARDTVYWPGITAQVKQEIETCQVCQESGTKQPKETLRSHAIPALPWGKVGMDIFQTKLSQYYLIIVDYYSDYFEIQELEDLRTDSVIKAVKQQFARHGIPTGGAL